ncbi:hypothetical protein H6P81_003140 [Aristolochia fimbriata]|uniref:Uncharacterized protein n=1 Tax=Aristolochia fimbriata TaxID=158543 RepID=A0AAV7FBQ0_ARIFI|nr:hypothetical protein H6P81_003140 [Aristolochia fimbriata]
MAVPGRLQIHSIQELRTMARTHWKGEVQLRQEGISKQTHMIVWVYMSWLSETGAPLNSLKYSIGQTYDQNRFRKRGVEKRREEGSVVYMREIITWVLQREANRSQLAGCPPPFDENNKKMKTSLLLLEVDRMPISSRREGRGEKERHNMGQGRGGGGGERNGKRGGEGRRREKMERGEGRGEEEREMERGRGGGGGERNGKRGGQGRRIILKTSLMMQINPSCLPHPQILLFLVPAAKTPEITAEQNSFPSSSLLPSPYC